MPKSDVQRSPSGLLSPGWVDVTGGLRALCMGCYTSRAGPAQLEVQGTAYALIHRLEPLLDGILLRSPSTLAPVCRFIFTNQLDYLKYMMPLCEH